MIPTFPIFKVVDLSDRQAIEGHTHRFPPYSDFNFTSLWSWDTSGERMISELNGNLVVRFTDYSTHEPFLSFLGDQKTEHTARTLIEHSKANGLPPLLKLVPETSIKDMRTSVLEIKEDRNNFDYIYSVPSLASLRGNTYMSKRGRANKFRREYSESIVETVDLANKGAQESILQVLATWEKGKIGNEKEYEIEHERNAIRRLCDTADSHELVVLGIFLERVMTAFSIEELLPDGYSICHFWKGDSARAGIFDFLMQEKAKHLETLGAEYINYEQDLGIPALRTAKSSFRPINFLKKYTVGYAQNAGV